MEAPLSIPVNLQKEQSHYLKNVLRMSEGDRVRTFNGKDGEWLAALSFEGKKGILHPQKQLRPQLEEPGPWLFFSPLKKSRMEFLVEKAVELGVQKLTPVLTERTIVRTLNMEKIKSHIIEAAEQCERLTIPDLSPPIKLSRVFDVLGNKNLYFFKERGEKIPLFRGQAECALLIGPEGGFSAQEIEGLEKSPQIKPVSLGSRILRAETASLAALSRCL